MIRKALAALTLAALMAISLSTFAMAAHLVTVDEKYFLRRDDCGADDDGMRIETRAGNDSEGCAFLLGFAEEAGLGLTYDFPQQDGEAYVLDTDGVITGEIATSDFLGLGSTAAVLNVDVTITGSFGLFSQATLVDESYELVPVAGQNPTFAFEAEIDDALAGEEISNLVVSVRIAGAHGNQNVAMSGDSFFEFPHLVAAE